MQNLLDYQKILLLLKNIQIKDIFDVLFLSIFLFVWIFIITKTRSYKIIFGFFILVIVFSIANWFNLTLTNNLLQFVLPYIVLSLVIIFQKELRFFLEQIAIILPKKRIVLSDKEHIINNIMDALRYLSQNKIGAIFVFEKNVHLDTLLKGVKLINSDISAELIISIFNKNSPLHDGAIIINGSKIKYASAHLPLPEGYKYDPKLGTRHRAALGLSQLSDALILVVSEETGHISVMKNGKLYFNISEAEIIQELQNYYSYEKSNDFFRTNIKQIIKNLVIFLLSFIIAVSIWIINNYNKTKIYKIIEVPIEFTNLKNHLELNNINIPKVNVLISGDELTITNLQLQNIKMIVDLSNMEPGNYNITLNKNNLINLPKSIEVAEIKPDRLKFQIIEK